MGSRAHVSAIVFAIPLPCNSSRQITLISALVDLHSFYKRDHAKTVA
jgi:hypothetical protein